MNILFLEDCPATTFYNRLIVKQSNLVGKFTFIMNPKTALAFLRKRKNTHDFDLLFLDINMPYLTGWEFLDKLVEFDIHFPKIIILSPSKSESDFQKSEKNPLVYDHFHEPLSEEMLENLVIDFDYFLSAKKANKWINNTFLK